jgi:WbqC-like protein family
MKLAIMQPYLFPYLGYVQLMHSVDVFVIYDDVNFIKQGWINRNRILSAVGPQRLTLALQNASSNRNINQILVGGNRSKLLRSVDVNYRRAPFFSEGMAFVEACLGFSSDNLSDLLENSLLETAKLLGLKTKFLTASRQSNFAPHLASQDRVLAICKALDADQYINLEGGAALYANSIFTEHGIDLKFLRHNPTPYPQFPKTPEFVSHLSVVDALMFIGKEGVKEKLADFTLFQNQD